VAIIVRKDITEFSPSVRFNSEKQEKFNNEDNNILRKRWHTIFTPHIMYAQVYWLSLFHNIVTMKPMQGIMEYAVHILICLLLKS